MLRLVKTLYTKINSKTAKITKPKASPVFLGESRIAVHVIDGSSPEDTYPFILVMDAPLNLPGNGSKGKRHFKIEIEGKYAFINYGEFGSQIALVHTKTDSELEGAGAASAVVKKTVNYLKKHNLK